MDYYSAIKRGQSTDTCYNVMLEKHYAKWNWLSTKGHIFYDRLYTTSRKSKSTEPEDNLVA